MSPQTVQCIYQPQEGACSQWAYQFQAISFLFGLEVGDAVAPASAINIVVTGRFKSSACRMGIILMVYV